MKRTLAACAVAFSFLALPVWAQSGNSGTVFGSVLDSSGAAIKGAAVAIQNPVSHYSQNAVTDEQGKFQFGNIPFNNYHVSVAAPSFQQGEQDVAVRTPVPAEVKIT